MTDRRSYAHYSRSRLALWRHSIDHETFWIMTLSAPVLASWVFALVLISHNNAFP